MVVGGLMTRSRRILSYTLVDSDAWILFPNGRAGNRVNEFALTFGVIRGWR